jgi:MYXO-CTERM domain-containing protein
MAWVIRARLSTWMSGAIALAAGLVAGNTNAADQDFDNGCIAVVVDSHNTIISTNAMGGLNVNATALAQQFYQTHGDDYDSLLVFPNFNTADGSFHQIVFNDIAGLGPNRPTNFDNRAAFGAATRLQSFTQYVNFTNFAANLEQRIAGNNDSPLSLIAQEVGHRWAAFPDLGAALNGGDATILRGRQRSHWSYYTNARSTGPRAGASSLEGNVWADNGDGTFTTSSQTDGFSELDQYMMGVRDSEAVTPFFYIQNPSGGLGRARTAPPFTPGLDGAPDTVNGTRINVTIDDIVAQNGARAPEAAAAQKQFKQAFILLAQGGAAPGQAVIDQLEALRAAWTQYFAEETSFLGEVDTCIDRRPIDIMFLLDLSGSFADDLPVLQANVGDLMNDLLSVSPGSRFGLASFVDFPFAPYGDAAAGDYTYRLDVPLTADTEAFVDAINAATTHSGADLPQDQYEALYQVMTGEGLDLDDDGLFTGLGEVEPSDIGHDPNVPLFVLVFTDATFHDPDIEPDYPTGAFNSVVHGRSDVLAVFQPPLMALQSAAALQSTPSLAETTTIFGMVAGLGSPELPEIPQLEELASLTGGQLFPLSVDSAGFVAATRSAVDETELPVIKPFLVLEDVTVAQGGTIHWGTHAHDRCNDRNHGQSRGGLAGQGQGKSNSERNSLVDFRGTLVLPEGVEFTALSAESKVSVSISDVPIISQSVTFEASRVTQGRRDRTLWRFTDCQADGGVTTLEILWVSPSRAEYRLVGEFDAESFGLSSARLPPEVALVLSVGGEGLAYSRSLKLAEGLWTQLDADHWRTGADSSTGVPTPSEAFIVRNDRLQAPVGGSDVDSDAAESSDGLGCGVASTRGGASGTFSLFALLGAAAVVVLRRRSRSAPKEP